MLGIIVARIRFSYLCNEIRQKRLCIRRISKGRTCISAAWISKVFHPTSSIRGSGSLSTWSVTPRYTRIEIRLHTAIASTQRTLLIYRASADRFLHVITVPSQPFRYCLQSVSTLAKSGHIPVAVIFFTVVMRKAGRLSQDQPARQYEKGHIHVAGNELPVIAAHFHSTVHA